jgi:hypothetical protein
MLLCPGLSVSLVVISVKIVRPWSRLQSVGLVSRGQGKICMSSEERKALLSCYGRSGEAHARRSMGSASTVHSNVWAAC